MDTPGLGILCFDFCFLFTIAFQFPYSGTLLQRLAAMTSRTKTGRLRLSIPTTASSTKVQIPSRLNSATHDCMDLSSTVPDDDYSQDTAFSLSPTFHSQSGFSEMTHWGFNDVLSSDISSTSEATEESFDTRSIQADDYEISDAQMLPFSSCSPPLFPSADGSADQSIPELGHLPGLSDSQENAQLCLTHPQAYRTFSTLNLSFENDAINNSVELGDRKSLGLGISPQHMIKPEAFTQGTWGSISGDVSGTANLDMSGPLNHVNQLPATPPLTEPNRDFSGNSSCSQGYPFTGQDECQFVDFSDTSSLSTQNFSIGEPFYPLTPPLVEQDPNRTIRPHKQSQRPILSAALARPSNKESDLLHLEQPVGQRPKDLLEARNPRDHAFYSYSTRRDGKYHCPFAEGKNPCKHNPTTQKCTYHKYLDSHLKPYRCKVPQCVDAHFSSNACLFRHEREAHGMHGHGENPHLCRFPSCDRSIPGNGFPRRWNLHDHMRRVHDYTSSEKASSPERSPISAGKSTVTKKKDGSLRKRKGVAAGGQVIKRVRAAQAPPQSQATLTAIQAHTDQQLQNAERSYYDCLSEIKSDLGNINPQDPSIHERINARLQELHTHALNYRYIKASQLSTKRPC
ncbi:hypothetical protein LOZ12_005687 [Ophidiomyces ophidiicola]|nr:hypothetical protein LOZ12_005687 [Ophidiomyces ophidiicola]